MISRIVLSKVTLHCSSSKIEGVIKLFANIHSYNKSTSWIFIQVDMSPLYLEKIMNEF